MYIPRLLEDKIIRQIKTSHKIIVIYGPRQVGKTTLSKKILDYIDIPARTINSDIPEYQKIFEKLDINELQLLPGNSKILFIDEAHQLANIGKALKILYDELPELKIIATGSSSFDLSSKITEPLTGRKFEYMLFPFLLKELDNFFSYDTVQLKSIVNQILIYGTYPEVFLAQDLEEKANILSEVAQSYLFKDILSLTGIKYPQKLKDLTMFLAFHIGQPVSINELCDTLSLNHDTVEHYLDLLQKTFVIFKLPVFSSRFRNVLKKKSKYYFYDLGIRNAIISRFTNINLRDDTGQLWENFVIAEKIKSAKTLNTHAQFYYWRTYDGAEIDLIEVKNEQISAYEIKLKKYKKNPPKSWQNIIKTYTFNTINMDNFHIYIL